MEDGAPDVPGQSNAPVASCMLPALTMIKGYEILDEEIDVSFNDWAHGTGGRPAYVDPSSGAPLYEIIL